VNSRSQAASIRLAEDVASGVFSLTPASPDHPSNRREVDASSGQSANYEQLACQFEIYRAEEVRISSSRFAGGDWHWHLSGASGQILVAAGGYRDELACREAVALLQHDASIAKFKPKD